MQYSIELQNNRMILVNDTRFQLIDNDWPLFDIPVSTRLGSKDRDTEVFFEEYTNNGSIHIFTWKAKSILWDKKTYTLSIHPSYATYQVSVEGEGAPDSIEYFHGCTEDMGIHYEVAGYLIPQFQDVDETRAEFLMPTEGMVFPLRAAPPPFVMPFWSDYTQDWCGVGIAAHIGQNNYERFILKSYKKDCCWFELPLLGYTDIKGSWSSPFIWFGFGHNSMDVIHQYAEWTYSELNYPRNKSHANAPRWWKEPILCGWGEQCYLSGAYHCSSDELARQDFYEKIEERIDRVGLRPGCIMIDDKWQKDYGTLQVDTEKWPDMRGFVDRQHQKGRHVILWFRQWIAEGLPGDECTKQRRLIATTDPTNPKYLERLKEQIHYLLSSDEGCMNCDGFKLDFLDCLPRTVPGVITYEKGVYGIEMMRRQFEAVYRFAKEIKPDALINTSSVHPYFADICDQIRLHDYAGNTRCHVSMMKFRAAITKASMPEVLIDTDGEDDRNPKIGLYKILHDMEYGVPALYSLSPYSDEELQRIQSNWENYCNNL